MEKNEDETIFQAHTQTDSKILTNKPDETGALKAAYWHGKQREIGKNRPFLYKIRHFFLLFRHCNLFFQAIFCQETYNVFTPNKQCNDRKHTSCPPNTHFPEGWDIHSRLLPAPFIFFEKSRCQHKSANSIILSAETNKAKQSIPTPKQAYPDDSSLHARPDFQRMPTIFETIVGLSDTKHYLCAANH